MVASHMVVLWHKIVLSPPEWFLVEIADSAHTGISLVHLDRSFSVSVWTIISGRFLQLFL